MSTPTEHANGPVLGSDIRAALSTIERQRLWKQVGVVTGFAAVVVALFGFEAAMLASPMTPTLSGDLQPGQLAPYAPD